MGDVFVFRKHRGRVIVLGARERDDGSLEIVGVEDPDRFVKSFWDTTNNRSKVSLNVLSDRDVSSGVSDPRNETVLKMFTLIDIGERAGSGIPTIAATWGQMKWNLIEIVESNEPARVNVRLELPYVEPVNGEREPVNGGLEPVNEPVNSTCEPVNDDAEPVTCEAILAEIAADADITYDELAERLHCSRSTIRRRLEELKTPKRIAYIGSDKSGHWEVL